MGQRVRRSSVVLDSKGGQVRRTTMTIYARIVPLGNSTSTPQHFNSLFSLSQTILYKKRYNSACIVVRLFFLLTNPEVSILISVLCKRSRNSVIARRGQLSAVPPLNFPVAFLSFGSTSIDFTPRGIGCPSENT